jgi:two-component system sensor histidine kinase BaeS
MGGLALVLSIVFSRRLTRPLKKLAFGAEAIIEGNPGRQVAVLGNDEVSHLSVTFNRMTKFLEAQESLRKKLISNVTHEIRTPLSAMRGELAGIIDGLIPCDKDQMASLYEETERLENILEGIEELSRVQTGALLLRKQTEKLKPILLAVRNKFENLFLDKGVALEIRCGDQLSVYADSAKLTQIIVNLVSNALKATETGGQVWTGGARTEKGVRIEVGDTGRGIGKEDLPFVFERFFRTSEEGLGIGLAIVKELVEAHEGTIEVKSEYGKGTVFTLYLPDE